MLLGSDVDGQVSREFETACLEGCRKLIESARHGHAGKAKDAGLTL
jgi:hypothetical protein